MAEGGKAVESFASTKASIGKAQAQVDDVLKSLNELSSGRDLRAAFQSYTTSVGDMRMMAKRAADRAKTMRERQDAMITKWQEEMSTLSDPNLKSTLEQRREAVRANYEQVRSAGQDVRDAYDPFIAKLGEIEKALSINLTPATVNGIRPTLDQAQSDGRALKQKLSNLQEQLDRIQAGLTPTGAAKR